MLTTAHAGYLALKTPAGLPLALRPCEDSDHAFLCRLVRFFQASTMDLGFLSEPEREAMLTSQFTAQTQHNDIHFPRAERWIVEQAGTAVGRLYLDRTSTPWRLLDILLLGDAQNQGIGRTLLGWVQEGADSVALHVAITNPRAEAFYRALGFAVVEEEGMYRYMEWQRG